MVDVVQRLEHRIVIPGVVGSNPIIHPARALFREEITPSLFVYNLLNFHHLTRTPLHTL